MSANLGILARQYQLEDMKDDIMLLVVNGFLQVLFNKENLAIQNSLLEIAKTEMSQIKALVDTGVLPRGELFELQATVATQEQQAVAASNNYEIARISLAQLLLIEDYKNFAIAETNYDMVAATILNESPEELFEKFINFIFYYEFDLANIDVNKIKEKISNKEVIYDHLADKE